MWYFTLLQRTDKLSISFKVKIELQSDICSCQLLVQLDIDISTRFKVSLFTVYDVGDVWFYCSGNAIIRDITYYK